MVREAYTRYTNGDDLCIELSRERCAQGLCQKEVMKHIHTHGGDELDTDKGTQG